MYQFNQYYLYRDIVFKNNKSTFKMFVHKVLLLFLFFWRRNKCKQNA